MAVQKSPGQKRKQIVIVGVVILFAISTYFGGKFLGAMADSSLSWVDNHTEIKASVTELAHEEEEYRNRKGRKRTRNVYYLSYNFSIDGELIENHVDIDERQYSALEQGNEVDIWYSNQDFYINDTQKNVEQKMDDNTAEEKMFSAAMYTAPASYFLYWILSIIFVRESKKALPEGFYTETSWLDVDDKYLVALDGSDLVYFDIDNSKVSTIQEAYQKGVDLEELIGNSKSSKFKRIPLAEITELTSHHNSDVISIEHNDDSHSIEFLNQTVKSHALKRISKYIPSSLSYNKNERTRIQAAIPAFLWLIVLLAIVYFADIFLLNVLIGIYAVISVIPKIIGRLLDPTVTETWETVEVEEADTVTE